MKEYRELNPVWNFYRLKSPFEGNETVLDDSQARTKKQALGFWYRERNVVNADLPECGFMDWIRILSTEMSIMKQKTTGMS